MAFAALVHTGAQANEWLIGSGSVVVGSGDNQSVSATTPRETLTLSPARVTGSGENLSVELLTPPAHQPARYIAVIEGSGENLSVRHIPVPRG
ncbi:hypothetical protein [Roseomonas sp. HF4]|uniref:hypothetical protein n=1 Tax=Roseomonas sp. HF4 TaxID=2562313 RepID=UPI0010C0A458|nr:hypothetical protein [Roseomonas sp. HF4]